MRGNHLVVRIVFSIVFTIASHFLVVSAFASQLTGDYCNKPMEIGVVMMGKPTELSGTYALQLFRQDMTQVTSGGIVRIILRSLLLLQDPLIFSRHGAIVFTAILLVITLLYLIVFSYCVGTYSPSEVMTIKLFPKLFQAAFEVRGAFFLNGKCGGNRVTGQSATVIFPSHSDGMRNVSVHGAWAKGYSTGVMLVAPFILFPSEVSGHNIEIDEF